jgi:hypothetical protein
VGSSASKIRLPVARRGDRDPLLLPAGQLVREVLEALPEPHALQGRGGHRARVPVPAGHVHPELDVLERGQRGEEVERLEDEAQRVAAEAKQLAPRGPRDVWPATPRPRRRVERADRVQRGLAAARGRSDDELALGDASVTSSSAVP